MKLKLCSQVCTEAKRKAMRSEHVSLNDMVRKHCAISSLFCGSGNCSLGRSNKQRPKAKPPSAILSPHLAISWFCLPRLQDQIMILEAKLCYEFTFHVIDSCKIYSKRRSHGRYYYN
ncbi:hypothetical protein ACTXT7_002993 [Hymenolepis weldensis]